MTTCPSWLHEEAALGDLEYAVSTSPVVDNTRSISRAPGLDLVALGGGRDAANAPFVRQWTWSQRQLGYATQIEMSEVGGDSLEEQFELRANIRERLGAGVILHAHSREMLIRAAQALFDSTTRSLSPDAFCGAVLERLAIQATPARLQDASVRNVLGFATLPFDERAALLERTMTDLRTLERLIAYYEPQRAVAAFREGETPRNHADGMLVAFYRRCLDERAAITAYLTARLDEVAIRQAEEREHFLVALGIALREPPPYTLQAPRGEERLDVREINEWRHRVRPLPVADAHELGALYDVNREEFYARLEARRPAAQLFDIIDRAATRIDRLGARRAAFAEMKALYETARWYGLFALALPQVEGLFTEMVDLASPAHRVAGRALSEKVRFVREFASVHAQNLDYFEFVVPEKRNRFAHTGKVDAPRLSALEILHDLAYVCEIYIELETPVIELAGLLAEPKVETVQRWARIYELLDEVTRLRQRPEIEAALTSFTSTMFPDDGAKRDASLKVAGFLRDKTREFRDYLLKESVARLGIEVDLDGRRTQEIVERSADIRELVDETVPGYGDTLLPLTLRTVARGMLATAALPTDAAQELERALADVRGSLSNLDAILELRARRAAAS